MRSLTLLHKELSAPFRYALALALFTFALLLRLLILPIDAGFPFVTMYPATVAVFYFCGTRPGLLTTALSALTGFFIFLPPHWTFVHGFTESFIVCIYLMGALLTAAVVHQLQRYSVNLHTTLLRLRDSESRFRSFMDNSNFLSWMKDESGRYIFLNSQYPKRFNLPLTHWLGKTDFDLFPETKAQQLCKHDHDVIATGEPVVSEETSVDHDGTVSYWLSTKFRYTDSAAKTYIGGIAVDITARKLAEERIESLAFYDPLTGLPNRRLLLDRLTHVLDTGYRHQRLGALLFIDLDNFKVLNDTLGHDQGDLLLQMVAERLITNVRKGDTLARLGGDEFVIILEDLSPNALEAAAKAEVVAEKILATLGQPYPLAEMSHRSTPSIGITLFGESAESMDEPLKRADMAMYQAKAAGRNTLRFFDPAIQAAVTARVALESDLRAAVTQQQLLLYYQPQIAGANRLTGVEALVRWLHPQRGMVSPAEFIPLAEDTGIIITLGRWVLDTACAQLAAWAKQPALADLTIAVNVSPRQFHQHNFVDEVLSAIATAGANPRRLKLELTEGLLVTNVEDVIAKMIQLKNEGVGFSLDDFGTGYSSLAYLKRLPLDQLKIDQSFVRDILTDANDAAIAKTIIALAESLGLAVIAEGVETQQQRDFLAAQGCHAYQGFLFSRPLPVESFEQFVAQR
jgi:diguanylate cyclase (GGDEF)-like protein/PAS domain S-box-containing protein